VRLKTHFLNVYFYFLTEEFSMKRTLLKQTLLAASLAGLGFASFAQATLPQGGVINRGAAGSSITYDPNGNLLTVNQGQNAIMTANWSSFNIGAGKTVNFVQPNAQAIALNRVTGTTASAIHGNLNANGQVFLINPNGILFGKTAQVNVGGLVATTHNIADSDIVTSGVISSRLNQNVASTTEEYKTVQNFGTINTTGSVVLAAFGVRNHGTINADGNASLIRSDRAILTLDAIGLTARSANDSTPINDGYAATENSILINGSGGVINAGNKVTIHSSGTFFNYGDIQSGEEINLNTGYKIENLGSLKTANLIIERSNWFINGSNGFNSTTGIVNAQNLIANVHRFQNTGTLNIDYDASFHNTDNYAGQIFNYGIINVGNNLNIGMLNARRFDDFINAGRIVVSNAFNTKSELNQRSRFINTSNANIPSATSGFLKANSVYINYDSVSNEAYEGGIIGNNIDIRALNYITNKGLINGAMVSMAATDINNIGTAAFIKGNDVYLTASHDIANSGVIGQTGTNGRTGLQVASSVVLNAGHWIANLGAGIIGKNSYRTRIHVGEQLFNYATIGSYVGQSMITGNVINRGVILGGVAEAVGGSSLGALGGDAVDR
jgi:filamentous hemagglutinin family protein